MERLGSAKWLEIFERFRDLKKVEKHWFINIVDLSQETLLLFRQQSQLKISWTKYWLCEKGPNGVHLVNRYRQSWGILLRGLTKALLHHFCTKNFWLNKSVKVWITFNILILQINHSRTIWIWVCTNFAYNKISNSHYIKNSTITAIF